MEEKIHQLIEMYESREREANRVRDYIKAHNARISKETLEHTLLIIGEKIN